MPTPYHESAFIEIVEAGTRLWQDVLGQEGRRRLEFQFFDGEGGFRDSTSPEFTSVPVMGRSQPYQLFGNTDSRTIDFELIFHVEDDVEEVRRSGDWLRALMLPWYDSEVDITYGPPRVLLSFGALYNEIGYITSAELNWRGPFDVESLNPHHLVASITFKAADDAVGLPNGVEVITRT